MPVYRILLCFLFLIFSSIIIACESPGESESSDVTVISGATLFDGNGGEPVTNSVIVVRNGLIDCIGSNEDCDLPENADRVDATGQYITPGMIDVHMHFFQTGFFDSRPDAMDLNETYPFPEVAAFQQQNPERYYESYLCSGVTGVYDVGGASWSIALQEHAENHRMAPHVAAAGPLITPAQGAPFDLPSDKVLVPLNTVEDGIRTVQYLSELGSTGIKFWQLASGDEEYMSRVEAAAEEIEKRGNQMIAHATTLEQAKAALQNGTKLLVHSVSDREVDEEFINLALENGTVYNPTLIVSSGYVLAYRAAAGIEALEMNDPNGCVDEKTLELIRSADQFSDHPRLSGGLMERIRNFDPETDRVSSTNALNLMKVYEAGIPVAVGTDAGNPGTLHGISIFDELEAMQDAGITAHDLIVMASKNGAMAMRRLDDFGTLEAGKMANMLLLNENPSADITNMRSIHRVMIKSNLREP